MTVFGKQRTAETSLRNVFVRMVGGVILAILLSGCPQNNTTQTQSSTPKASPRVAAAEGLCRLVTADEMKDAAGAAVTEARYSGDNTTSGARYCTYTFQGGGRLLLAIPNPGERKSVAEAKQDFSGGEDVAGIGDAAYWHPSHTFLAFEKGSSFYEIDVSDDSPPPGDPRALAEAAAKVAITRI